MITVIIPTTPDREEQLQRCVDAVKKSVCRDRIDIVIERNEYEGFVKPVLRALKKLNCLCLLLGNDAIVRHDSIEQLRKEFVKAFPHDDGLAAPVDQRPNVVRLPSHPFAHSKVLLENIYPKYFHNFVDKDLGQVMWRKGKFIIVKSAVIDHLHYTMDRSSFDFTYRISESTSEADGEIYRQRLARGFDLKPSEVKVDLNKSPFRPC